MKINITTKNLNLDDNTKKLINRKFTKIGRHLPQARELRLDLLEEATKAASDRFVARGFLDVLGPVKHAECRASTLVTAIDELAAVMERQARDFKTKGIAFDREPQRLASATYTDIPPEPPILSEDSEVSIDVEHVTVKPMSLPEAIAAITDTNDDFVLFRNPKGGISLLHRQLGGGFRLIEVKSE